MYALLTFMCLLLHLEKKIAVLNGCYLTLSLTCVTLQGAYPLVYFALSICQ